MGVLKLPSVIFPAPKPTYNDKSFNDRSSGQGLFKIERNGKVIPFLFLPCFNKNNQKIAAKSIIYFHGNSQDLGSGLVFLLQFRRSLKYNIFAMEYPGYGVLWRSATDSEVIKQNSKQLYKYINQVLGFQEKDIILIGRSIGSGPATYLAKQTNVGNLVLISPFLSIRDVARQHTCLCVSFLLYEHFPNDKYFKDINSRILVIHGLKDQIIPVSNALRLQKIYNRTKKGKAKFEYIENMTHNKFHLYFDILLRIENFMATEPKSKGIHFRDIKQKLEQQIKK